MEAAVTTSCSAKTAMTILMAERGSDVIVGGDGDDKLRGGSDGDSDDGIEGRDILIGGRGEDDLKGGKGEDLLIGGFTAFDSQESALQLIAREWTSAHNYELRIENLRAGAGEFLNGSSVSLAAAGSGQSVFDDGEKDKLKGDKGRDWFFANFADDSEDAKSDELLDL